MPFHFCPQCGTKLQPGFRFCPSCGEKLPCAVDESGPVSSTASLSLSPPKRDEAATSAVKTSLASTTSFEPADSKAHACISSIPITTRPALRKTRNSLRLDKDVTFNIKDVAPPVVPFTNPVRGLHDRIEADNNVGFVGTPPKQHTVTFKLDATVEPTLESSSSPVVKSPRQARGKAKLSSPAAKQLEEGKRPSRKAEESTVDGAHVTVSSPVSSPVSRSPMKATCKSKAKKAKHMSAVEPLQEGQEVTDKTGRKWKLVKLLSQSTTELIYEVFQTVSRSNSKESNHILKLAAKDGRIFNEQNFLQRAAKPASVDKWIKQNKMDFLGIPSCVGFGLHAESYRFLIFPNMGQSLESVMEEEDELLPEKAVLQLACRIIDVLQYVHSNEYVHADINAENIYIQPGQKSQIYLVGYCHAFRYCPGGQHVEYREASRTPHEGTVEFISLDAHKGAAPSRRSDLQSLGYCMLRWHTGALPWTALTHPDQVATQKQRYMEDVPALLSHCFGKKRVSSALQTYLTAVMALQYSEQPDYSALKAGLSVALLQLGGSPERPLSF
ncbi:inactive serine/threonine-protein kinase VRK3 isoform X1 [Dicentrarchus labrax]|uniref:Protein kinase domain-containing protein n=1 Tax=Dicentrarchus labrax TaxID=13489 RepID=A0A8C4F3X4_DICLA|nr:inactive serine/threonine-protein kinase VRK3 isoform X1 [Dicentrarchus labrax]XP_051235168.1 inactive serine/threonine-protein kinase VRK3 isoform X1 [Dicentrarchus labrax]XP_051235169.1 inactive serine/threonine-protein kinase VRK3 isoform X1 [Dicentrarchus labrax]